MPHSSKTPADWRKVQAAYQRGEGSCRVLAERFGLTQKAVSSRCLREGWKRKLRKVAEEVEKKVEAAVVSDLVAFGQRWVKRKIERVERAEGDIDACRAQFATDPDGRPVMDMLNIKHMVAAERDADDIVRRAVGLHLGDAGRMKFEADGKGGVTLTVTGNDVP